MREEGFGRPEALWTVGAAALVLAPHAAHLPPWLSAAAATLLLWRFAAALGRAPLPGRAMLMALALLCGAAILAAYHTLFGREAGVAMLTLMLALKLMEMRSRRDAMLTVFLGLFMALTHFLYGQGVLLAVYLFGVTLLFIATLARLTHPALPPTRLARLVGTLVLQGLPLMLLLFLLFPRLPGPLWGLPKDAFAGRTGLSETMTPGAISRLVQSDAVVFRAAFEGPPPPPAQRYWRGPVLEIFDGRSWLPWRGHGPEPRIEGMGPPLAYTLTLEPQDKPWVFALEQPDPRRLPGRTRLSAAQQLLAPGPVVQRTRFSLFAWLRYRVEAEPEALARALELPPAGNPRARALAGRLRAFAREDRAVIEAALELFHREPFHYTLQPPLLGEDGVDGFLFETRRGFCEHYAGAFTFLMRAAGLPARVVTGYQGGEFNELGGYLIVRQSDAHAWSEVWLQGEGWVRVDPTAAVAASRIEQGLAAALPEGEPLPFLLRQEAAWLRTARMQWDALNTRWNQWVIGFDQERQLALLARLGPGMGIVSWRQLAGLLAAAMGLFLAALAWIVLRAEAPRDPVQAGWGRFCRRLARVGLARAPTEGPLAYARRVGASRPDLAATVQAIAEGYARLRYGPPAPPAEVRRWRRQVAAFRPRRAAAPPPGRP